MKKNYKLHEAIADIALVIGGMIKGKDEYDSRLLVRNIVVWAKEFEEKHKDVDWDSHTEDYMASIERFAENKWKSFFGETPRKLIGYQIDFGEDKWPEGLFSFQVFRTKEAAMEFLEERSIDGCRLVEIYEGDVENPSFIGMKPIAFKDSLTEQEIFDLFARVFKDKDLDIYNEDEVYETAKQIFSESCNRIESVFPWLKDGESDGENTWYDEYHDEIVSLYCSMLKGEVRCCDYCGKPMKEGYYLFGEYACSDECCLALFNGDKEQMDESLKDELGDNDYYYWTEWESIYND